MEMEIELQVIVVIFSQVAGRIEARTAEVKVTNSRDSWSAIGARGDLVFHL